MKLTIPDSETTAPSPTGPVLVRPYQIVLPIALSVSGRLSQRFPAILDPGHSHNLSLSAAHVRDWIRMPLRHVRWIRANNVRVPLVEADIDLDGTILHCPEGVSVFPDGHPAAPRLPLLGSRRAGMARNKIKIVIDGMDVTVG